ncbi:PTS-dependent dihydroxyacetone kinase phosphotransferase subunit DhaM [Virgibacillus pantothenticus]|uniref:phosphoenolpyruvate--glycerone phosphotransferase n=1 Tax=Virgibacillus pantothenticus TaxID=1473 RepID=A0A0L0QN10_VIRPA|nr:MULTISPECIES: dihydroxyacetone kinase phosphoryl donor subunit DhaM [Virgibacillus]API93347.1 PTS-dependent dihydroxyacetone kinase phosphotransferase subunit DhaM [Virgibacillus sp. 6R]KNE19618.1 PTS mannose transporter subunit IID [Virgibacillus pantothenticus]MBS7428599.1 PTS-dependent dihydroxyacetone kinase phosphotransferase subunit DhaM [Virgibacillus sp. 19R1-5]MBU8567528.1 PTS-dependent dihydroxyacetone kinase phosphotransferase subunit DhaM [Virgibacillus pantothenticus]MBU8601317
MSYVGIVLISHSHKIAEGTKELIQQVMKNVPIVAAGGTDENEIGTSIEKINAALEQANKGKGVLLFYDLGSAKMNAEMAIEMADREDVKLVEVPIVEGSYVAAVESGMGKSINDVYEAVRSSFPEK